MSQHERIKRTRSKTPRQVARPTRTLKAQEEPSVLKWPEPVERMEQLRDHPAVEVLRDYGIQKDWLIRRLRQAAIEMMGAGQVDQAQWATRSQINQAIHEVWKGLRACRTLMEMTGTSLLDRTETADFLTNLAWELEEKRQGLSMLAEGKRPSHRPSYKPIWDALAEVVDRIKRHTGKSQVRVWGTICEIFRAAFPYLNVNSRTLQARYQENRPRPAHHRGTS